MSKKAVVLLSGGLDSATSAAAAADKGFELSALTFDYGQRHSVEILAAKKIAAFLGIRNHIIINIPSEIFKTALVGGSQAQIPKNRVITPDEIPDTYVPARNIIFLSYALAYAESIGAETIFIGANALDYSGYPDCRPEFFEAFAAMAAKGTKAGIEGHPPRIETPLISMTKAAIISLGSALGLDYSLTHSCYDPDESGAACGTCDSCMLRKKGFAEAMIPDPTRYIKE
ncbi:MAG: 7-cyano-7-deazaguanine synthase QueC [Spirochaetia bacterium]|jgi:7-cyano-7-deazaguanine synthase|nr:7-cyano-7-deazaguanine synthase QueC [Spirochaetia bacterium]